MSKRCELQKEYYKDFGNYKGDGKYSDKYVAWLEDQVQSYKAKAIEKTNAPELLEALKKADKFLKLDLPDIYNGSLLQKQIINAINKATL